MRNYFINLLSILILFFSAELGGQNIPEIISDQKVAQKNYLPDFSFAGYHNGEMNLPDNEGKIIYAENHGVIPDDGLDDSKALIHIVDSLRTVDEKVILQLPRGRIILSSILYIERSNFVLRGYGSGVNGTEIYFPRPLMYVPKTETLAELREYLVVHDKRQREKENNIDLPFSEYAWSGGFIWTQVPGERVKSYMGKYDRKQNVLAEVTDGERGEHRLTVGNTSKLNVGDVVELQLFNKEGENGSIIKDLYKGADVKVGSHHWKFPTLPIVRQQVEIVAKTNNSVTIKSPLTIAIDPAYQARIVEWKHLKEVGIENFKISFPKTPVVAHHVEPGNNGICLTRLFDSWVKDIVIDNADSGILTEEIANVTIQDITTQGENLAHYTVALAGVHNVLVRNLKVFNEARHPLSFNTFSTKNVYSNCKVFKSPILDQHSGANHQNLFDNIEVYVQPNENNQYGLFMGGGAGYWKPSHGAYSTFWNLQVQFENVSDYSKPVLLDGMKDGNDARVVGVYSDIPVKVTYGPNAYIEKINEKISVESLYKYQLEQRLKK